MIELSSTIKRDLDSNITNVSLLFYVNASGKEYYLSTESVKFESPSGGNVYWDDLIIKVGGFKESIDLRSKKIKLSGTSITINNALIHEKRFSDTIIGEMSGGIVDIYIKTQGCKTLTDCLSIASLKITGVDHDSSTINLKCEDRFIDEFHKELPLEYNTLYQDKQTFVADNERRIPVLYGHLKYAPAVVYIENWETETPFSNNNVIIVPDRAFLGDYDIWGIKPISPYVTTYNSVIASSKQLLITPDVLNIKLGDYPAYVYPQPPDKLNRKLTEGDHLNDYEFSSEWATQYTVHGNYIRLITDVSVSSNQKI